MKKIQSKIVFWMMLCSALSLITLATISINEANQRARADAESTLLWMARDYADRFSTELRLLEAQLGDLEQHLLQTLDLAALQNDPNYLPAYEARLAPYVQSFAETRMASKTAWVYFDPSFSTEPHDVSYADKDHDGSVDRQPYIPLDYYDSTPLPDDDKQWWYGPKVSGEIFWSDPYAWIEENGEKHTVITCARPLYLDGVFVGVFGSDYSFDDIAAEISAIKVYTHGYAVLFNKNMEALVHPPLLSNSRLNRNNPYTMQDDLYQTLTQEAQGQNCGVYFYEHEGEARVIACAKLSNGWLLGISPPSRELYSSVHDLTIKLLHFTLLFLLLCALISFSVGRRLSSPILHLAETARKIGKGNFDVRSEVHSRDELGALSDSMNRMTENLAMLQESLLHQAHYDDLTGAKQLRKFKLDAAALLAAHPLRSYSLLKFDIDKFKMLNELHGFAVGDQVLRCVVEALGEVLQPEIDTFARVTADEFIVLLETAQPDDLDETCRRFRQTVYQLTFDPLHYRILFKMGVCKIDAQDTDIALLFEQVNLAHRTAKQQEGDDICLYDEALHQLIKCRKEIESRMQAALENGEFQLYLQPKYRLEDARMVGAEALVRWQSPQDGLLPPLLFIPTFEQNGFIRKLDFYMLEQSCKTLRALMDRGLPPLSISVNFSRLHLGAPDFLERICRLIDRYQIPRNYIEVELTETAMITNADLLSHFSTELRGLGMKLSMDDFGSGYSSLGLLKSIPVDVIKLDRSFFVGAENEYRTTAVLSAIIRMAKSLHVKVVAEGVEELAHVELLRNLGCDIVQGYYFARPMPCADFDQQYASRFEARAALDDETPALPCKK